MPKSPVVLHVDDDGDIREIVQMALELVGGLTVVQCATGKEAVEIVSDTKPDLFLLDVMMPDMDGVETLMGLRGVPGFENTPAFFMTAKAQNEDLRDLLDLGAIAIIPKPFDATTISDELMAMYNRAMENAAGQA
ncbi:MAG: response regulator [Rhodobacteraceae bacterium]|nr:response regulator [Paracoccaceae bacterium]